MGGGHINTMMIKREERDGGRWSENKKILDLFFSFVIFSVLNRVLCLCDEHDFELVVTCNASIFWLDCHSSVAMRESARIRLHFFLSKQIKIPINLKPI